MKKSVVLVLFLVSGLLLPFFIVPAWAMEPTPSDEFFQSNGGRALSSLPIRGGQRWVGSYACSQGKTSLMLEVDSVTTTWDPKVLNVEGSFNFNYRYGQCVGQFKLRGAYDTRTRTLNFVPGDWVKNPCNYMSVAMEGTLSPNAKRYSGRIMNNSCGNFDVRVIE